MTTIVCANCRKEVECTREFPGGVETHRCNNCWYVMGKPEYERSIKLREKIQAKHQEYEDMFNAIAPTN